MSIPIFDPIKTRALLLGDLGVEWQLKLDFDEFRAAAGLASNAHADLGHAVLCLLVGLDEGASKLLQKAKQWVEVAIAKEEHPTRYFAEATEADRYHTLALCNWLLEGRHDVTSFKKYSAHKDRALQLNPRPVTKLAVDLFLPHYVISQAYERVVEFFQSARGLEKPKELSRVRSEAQMSYILARHRLGLEFTSDEVDMALQRFLTRHMDKWLGDGHAVRAAEWMKIAYWDPHEGQLSPQEAILKCYDHLPHCTRPM